MLFFLINYRTSTIFNNKKLRGGIGEFQKFIDNDNDNDTGICLEDD